MQAETTIYFVVWWFLFEYSSFDHFPYRKKETRNVACKSMAKTSPSVFIPKVMQKNERKMTEKLHNQQRQT